MNKKRPSMNKRAALLFVIFSVLFFSITYRFFVIQITGHAEGKALAAYAAEKYEKERTLEAARGSILDRTGEPLATDTVAYRLVAILDPSVTPEGAEVPNHVADPINTAKALSNVIAMDENDIYKKLTQKDVFQVEFGEAGRNLSYETKAKIDQLKLPGITFIRESMRSYPNGIFASHLLGFASFTNGDDNSDKLVGQLGLEKTLNSYLEGHDGKIQYKSDVWGYILPNANSEIVKAPKNGTDVYLTIDKKIQTFLEDAMNQVQEDYEPKKMMAIVANAKTGAILAMAQRPTFNPNTREGISDNWNNIIVEEPFEPGSTMKVFTLASAIEEGVFNPNEKYQSGQYKVPGGPIKDHNNVGWGRITFLEGVQRSSNVAFAYLLEKLGDETFREYLDKFKFGQPTGIELENEASGHIQYEWPIDKVSTAFGQATSVTALQLVQGMTAITNDGKMMKPYVIDKMKDSNGEVVKNYGPKQVGTPISADTASEVLDVLQTVVTSENGTGKLFNIEGYDVAGKTGTAQIYDSVNGGYLDGYDNYVFSFIGTAPKDDPELIVYVMVQQPDLDDDKYEGGSVPVSKIFNPVMKNSLQYLNIEPDVETEAVESNKLPDLAGVSTEKAKATLKELNLQPIIIGNGKTIKTTVPGKDTKLLNNEKILVITDGKITMPDMKNWSLADFMKFVSATSIPFETEGTGYITEQSIKPGTEITKDSVINVKLQSPLEQLEASQQTEGQDAEDSNTE
ncbi:penicillin-binding protein [Caldibacillus lycopersici]|uniref:serine-type D-Ala-D-Ala carboxypeptidase n=1 Tax=Perspicuibacillus lycopersici TaxID=1325689 RepID=A0AAE3IPI1_9BACI|nr:penicillin-binding protein [Perspicuibacillus lycopersici]MCU9612203.1 penicillin-binding protein [Perspicuibacillus lycopersici]